MQLLDCWLFSWAILQTLLLQCRLPPSRWTPSCLSPPQRPCCAWQQRTTLPRRARMWHRHQHTPAGELLHRNDDCDPLLLVRVYRKVAAMSPSLISLSHFLHRNPADPAKTSMSSADNNSIIQWVCTRFFLPCCTFSHVLPRQIWDLFVQFEVSVLVGRETSLPSVTW